MIQNTNYGASKTYVNTKVDKLTTSGVKAYTHDGATQGEIDVSNTYTPATLALRDSNGRMQAADPASGATDKTLVTANWISQTGDSAPNNVIHKTGFETVPGTKLFAGGMLNSIISSSMNKPPENIGGKCLKVLHVPANYNVAIIYKVWGTMSAVLTGIIDMRTASVPMNVVNKLGSDAGIDTAACMVAINADNTKDVYIKYRQNRRYNITIVKVLDLFNYNEVTDYTGLIDYSPALVDYPVADGVSILSVSTSSAM